ncbi:GntR family transcriptional regulator [Pseudolysinimonas kribbensis]|uniref:GntR family transcriptional regulator n=1 Tax=Pseudolysinimonas kribbensis TaxID=433641 RepID=A0ABQ6K438_9MICO|nr:GntR family transcriptional regulator [Pseudolysinimonas kribbensis]GMA94717.1 GntR family transcriptional regulator [Pseudolysinimonas kribbensis]
MTIELKTPSIVDALADAVRTRVLTGEFPAGSRLTEQEVASLYGVARPTAKAAIERVVQTGILRRTANKSALVPILSVADIEDLYRSRIFFEREVVANLAGRRLVTPEASAALDSLRMAEGPDATAQAVGFDIGFHEALVHAVGSERLNRMYETIVGEAHLCVAHEQSIFDPTLNWQEHSNLLEAIRTGDVELAVHRITDHLQTAADRLVAARADGAGLR